MVYIAPASATIKPMAKHRRPGPPDQPSRVVPYINAEDPLAAYAKRRHPPMDVHRRHRPTHGGAAHLQPDVPRLLEEWDGFAYQAVSRADVGW